MLLPNSSPDYNLVFLCSSTLLLIQQSRGCFPPKYHWCYYPLINYSKSYFIAPVNPEVNISRFSTLPLSINVIYLFFYWIAFSVRNLKLLLVTQITEQHQSVLHHSWNKTHLSKSWRWEMRQGVLEPWQTQALSSIQGTPVPGRSCRNIHLC